MAQQNPFEVVLELSEQNGKDKMRDLAKFVDENFRSSKITDIFNAFPQSLVVVLLVLLVSLLAISALRFIPISEWTPTLISITAIYIAYYSFFIASRKYANKRIAYREAKRLENFLTHKTKETLCLLPPLVALKMENYPIKLQDLYEVNKELFTVNKLMEKYYLEPY